jgi:hypothetical protein
MSKQPEALLIADQLLSHVSKYRTPSHERGVLNGAIQELRRLHAANAELADVLSDLLAEGEFADYPGTCQADAVKAARAALSKHKEQA